MTTTLDAPASPRTSYSKLNSWLICPRQFAFRYIEQAREEITPLSLIFGTAMHEALEAFMQSLAKPDPMSEAEVHGVFEARFKEEVLLAETLDTPIEWGSSDRESTIEQGGAMLSVFLAEVDRTLNVHGTEVGFEFALPAQGRILGFIDLILDDGEGRYRVVDFKTAARSYGPDKIEHDLQPTIYLEAAKRLLPDAVSIEFEYWVLTKAKKPKFEIVPVHRTQRDWEEATQTIDAVELGIAACAFYRRRGWQCNGCQYRQQCSA
ncbi:MAG: PD-(D/E)XK nuclease family protein [Planctomycetes bacterium]|nr:PD-(D/E)XK nuclease family protein [Planctomycetota bacterium]